MLGLLRIALPAAACALLLTTQTACESCSFAAGSLRMELEVNLVDAAGRPLTEEAFAARLATAELTACIDGKSAEQCMPAATERAYPEESRFVVVEDGQAYEPSAVSSKCYYPSVLLRVAIPGCGEDEREAPGGRTTVAAGYVAESLTLTCT